MEIQEKPREFCFAGERSIKTNNFEINNHQNLLIANHSFGLILLISMNLSSFFYLFKSYIHDITWHHLMNEYNLFSRLQPSNQIYLAMAPIRIYYMQNISIVY